MLASLQPFNLNSLLQHKGAAMGWCFVKRFDQMNDREYLQRELFRWSTIPAEHWPHVVDHAQSGSTHFFAVRMPAEFFQHAGRAPRDYVPDTDGSVTACWIILTKRDGGEFGWKDMDETMGPYVNKCPERLLKRLSGLTDPEGYAAKWRKACRAERTKPKPLKLVNGARVALPEPVLFRDGIKRQTFTVFQYRPRVWRLRCVETGALCKLDPALRRTLQPAA